MCSCINRHINCRCCRRGVPQVALAAVVARPDVKWGESVCAFIELK